MTGRIPSGMITFICEHSAELLRGRFRRKPRTFILNEGVRFGVRVQEISVARSGDERFDKRAFDDAVQFLSEHGVREVICADADRGSRLAGRGILPPSREPLERAMMPRVALEIVRRRQARSVAICARRRSRELTTAVELLSPKVRSIAILIPGGGEDYANHLRWSKGLSVRTDPSALMSAEVKLLLGEPGFPLGKGVAIGPTPYAGIGLEVVKSLKYIFPPSLTGSVYPPELIASALVKAGLLRAEEIGIKTIETANSIDNLQFSHYNAICSTMT